MLLSLGKQEDSCIYAWSPLDQEKLHSSRYNKWFIFYLDLAITLECPYKCNLSLLNLGSLIGVTFILEIYEQVEDSNNKNVPVIRHTFNMRLCSGGCIPIQRTFTTFPRFHYKKTNEQYKGRSRYLYHIPNSISLERTWKNYSW